MAIQMNDNEKSLFVSPSEQEAVESKIVSPISTGENKTSSSKPVLLIAEDNSDNYLLLKCILQTNFQLIHAWDGEVAVELFKKHQPQLILMDIRMPKMNGYEATAEIRKISVTVPIIAVTAYAYAQDIELILISGFNSYLSKPINIVGVKEKIQEVLKK